MATFSLSSVLFLVYCVYFSSQQPIIIPVTNTSAVSYSTAVKVFHYILGHWGESFNGIVPCGSTYCEWVIADHVKHLRNNFLYLTEHTMFGLPLSTLSLYNIHTVWEKARDTRPAICELPTNLTMAETEESWVRYSQLFDSAIKHFDGFSSTHPKKSSVQRVYKEAYLRENELYKAVNFSSLIKGATYIASDCHRRDSANANRDNVVQEIRNLGFRVDGLGRCMYTPPGPEGVSLPKTRDTRYNLHLKKQVIGKFMFHLAFENSIEDGYVTEKPFDALVAGTVPVYLGDPKTLKRMLPHRKAAIFVADYPDRAKLVAYLDYLMTNESAYEEHRAWRHTFLYEDNIRHKSLMKDNWYCKVCNWAQERISNASYASVDSNRHKHCLHPSMPKEAVKKALLGAEMEGKLIRISTGKQVYIVRKGVLHGIPDMATFIALKLDVSQIQTVEASDAEGFIIGEPEPRAG